MKNIELGSCLIHPVCTYIKHTHMPQLLVDHPRRCALGCPEGWSPVANDSDFVPSSCFLESFPKKPLHSSPVLGSTLGDPKVKLYMCICF